MLKDLKVFTQHRLPLNPTLSCLPEIPSQMPNYEVTMYHQTGVLWSERKLLIIMSWWPNKQRLSKETNMCKLNFCSSPLNLLFLKSPPILLVEIPLFQLAKAPMSFLKYPTSNQSANFTNSTFKICPKFHHFLPWRPYFYSSILALSTSPALFHLFSFQQPVASQKSKPDVASCSSIVH